MTNLPVIVGFGGVNPAGRSSFGHAYRRMVFDALDRQQQNSTIASLAQLMGLAQSEKATRQQALDGTLIRQLEAARLDPEAVPCNQRFTAVASGDSPLVLEFATKHLPQPLPASWRVEPLANGNSRVHITDAQELLLPSTRELKVQSAGQLPTGFEPGQLYNSRNHPRGLQMSVYAASDALGSMGIDWQAVRENVSAEQISVYAGSAMGQLDATGSGGMLSARFNGKRVSSKQCPLGFSEMPADFINAYVLGSLGNSGTSMGACASFLYNLRHAIIDIQSGACRVAIVGSSEAPILPEIIEGYSAMGALATAKELSDLDGGVPDYRRACRPFGNNCGFTLSESAQFVVLFDDTLAIELGAQLHGAVTDVFVNADGYKKSISAPGVGNYLTMARALASGRALLGEKALRERSFIQAHGTGTPQNRVTESDVLNRCAGEFGIRSWPVVAIKNFLGHSIGTAGADQLIASLGVWQDGILPGITHIDGPAADVSCSNLDISPEHKNIGANNSDLAIINAKGFGGNNASAVALAPAVVEKLLRNKHGSAAWSDFERRRESSTERAQQFDQSVTNGEHQPTYLFDHNVMDGSALGFSSDAVKVPGYAKPVDLDLQSPYKRWLEP